LLRLHQCEAEEVLFNTGEIRTAYARLNTAVNFKKRQPGASGLVAITQIPLVSELRGGAVKAPRPRAGIQCVIVAESVMS